eukprot:7516160-Pyramimonas_sp.AAC.1
MNLQAHRLARRGLQGATTTPVITVHSRRPPTSPPPAGEVGSGGSRSILGLVVGIPTLGRCARAKPKRA